MMITTICSLGLAFTACQKNEESPNTNGKEILYTMPAESSPHEGYQGSYVNYYITNDKVLVPNYNDPNDAKANAIVQTLYPNRKVVGIDVRNLYANGGMVHCVTQQQPRY